MNDKNDEEYAEYEKRRNAEQRQNIRTTRRSKHSGLPLRRIDRRREFHRRARPEVDRVVISSQSPQRPCEETP